jgi:hypothetical protein
MGSMACRLTRGVVCRGIRENKMATTPSIESTLLSLPLPMAMTLMASCGPALADDTAVDFANKNSGFLGYTNGGLVIAFFPIVVYGVFYLYRATINPKAKLQDLLFVAAFCVVVANIASILIFKKRVY